MVKNLLGNLAFSPSMLGNISFYIRRLHQEEFVRRLGLVFMSLAVGLQTLVIIDPPEPAIASGPNNIIYSGVTSVEDLLDKYDRNDAGNGKRDLQAIFNHYGISREDIANSKPSTIKSTDRDRQLRSIGRKAYGKTGETAVVIGESGTTVYERYLWSWDSRAYSTYTAFVGTTADGRWFAVIASCGNIVIDEPPPTPLNPIGEVSATCEAITGWAYDPNQITKAINVKVTVRLKADTRDFQTYSLVANLPEPQSPVAGNHGFRQEIPAKYKSSQDLTIYTVVALDSAGGGQDIDLARSASVGPCLTPEPEPEPEVCPLDPNLDATDPRCEVCVYNPDLLADDERCVAPEPEPEPCIYNDQLTANDPKCVPCPYDSELWVDDPACEEPFTLLVYDKNASNETQGIEDADGTTANPGDLIVYELLVENLGNQAGSALIEEDMNDVLEYAEVVSVGQGGLELEGEPGVFSWGEIEVEPGETVTRTLSVRIKNEIPATPALNSNPESFNLEMRNVFYNKTVVINVPRPLVKTPEVLAKSLPNTGPDTNAWLGALAIGFTTYFYMRNRQLAKELTIVKKAYASGGL